MNCSPAIDQRKNLLNLEESKRRLQQLESDIKSRQEQAKAEMAVLIERRNKGRMEMARERQRLSQVKLLAPMSGLGRDPPESAGHVYALACTSRIFVKAIRFSPVSRSRMCSICPNSRLSPKSVSSIERI